MRETALFLYAWLYRSLTGSYPRGTPMTDGGRKKKLDLNDAVISPFFVISAGVDAGLLNFTIYGFDFADPLMSFGGGADITTATIISVVTLMVAFATNRPQFSALGAIQTWLVIATLALVIAPPFFPLLDSLLNVTIAGLVAVVIQASGFYSLAYLGGNR